MADKKYNDVVYANIPGVGVVPGIVLNARKEQIGDTKETHQVLTILYAHPEDEQHAVHKAKDIGDVRFTVKPTTETNHFGWADTPEGEVPPEKEPLPPPSEPSTVLEGTFGELTDGGPLPTGDYTKPEDKVETVPVVEPSAESVPEPVPEEVFADPEGRTIGVPDAAGGYAHVRDNPFPPSPGQGDLTGLPISAHMAA